MYIMYDVYVNVFDVELESFVTHLTSYKININILIITHFVRDTKLRWNRSTKAIILSHNTDRIEET